MADSDQKPAPRAGRLREAAGYLDWLLNPWQRRSAEDVYDLLSTRALTETGLYLNLGYWREADDLDQASAALARLVADTAGIGPGQRVVDAGYGFADQDLLWMAEYKPQRIIGLNVTTSQVERARHRVAEAGFGDRVELLCASATSMPLPEESVDCVVALESAFHFRPRTAFFDEAWRVLRPGGCLVTADILPWTADESPASGAERRLSWWLVASRFAIPEENRYGRARYAEHLRATGFGEVQVESIRDDVYAPLHQWFRRHPEALSRIHPLARWPARVARWIPAERLYAGLDYVLARAVKPA